jgi:rare lipoprotein A
MKTPTRVRIPAASAAVCLCALALAGCGTFSGGEAQRGESPRRGGGYYLDDGPGGPPPVDLDQVRDAVPRSEPLHRGAARPYAVMGRSYTPMTELWPYRARGIATWYGRRYHGSRTSSGEVYDMYAMTAAHPVLPIPSYARVTNVANGRSVVVRINDRGPFLDGRLIDLSYVAAYKLDLLRAGSGLVEVESILPDSFVALAAPAAASAPLVSSSTAVSADTQPAAVVQAPDGAQPETPSAGAGLQGGMFYLQLGAFSVRENAERFLDRMRAALAGTQSSLALTPSGAWHRVQAGPYASRDAALEAANRMAGVLGETPVLIAPR